MHLLTSVSRGSRKLVVWVSELKPHYQSGESKVHFISVYLYKIHWIHIAATGNCSVTDLPVLSAYVHARTYYYSDRMPLGFIQYSTDISMYIYLGPSQRIVEEYTVKYHRKVLMYLWVQLESKKVLVIQVSTHLVEIKIISYWNEL